MNVQPRRSARPGGGRALPGGAQARLVPGIWCRNKCLQSPHYRHRRTVNLCGRSISGQFDHAALACQRPVARVDPAAFGADHAIGMEDDLAIVGIEYADGAIGCDGGLERIWGMSGPRAGLVNCGRKARKKIATLGLVTFITMPRR